jgi:1-acyl-sn-glycerol-3-phosphate acyltransferase
MNPIVYNVATWVSRYFLLPLYTRIQVYGIENVPITGPLVIASNHLNDADPGIICTRIPRRVAFMAKMELFKYPVLAHFLRGFGSFPVNRRQADLGALRTASELLSQDMAVCIFPEGTREGPTEKLKQGLPGAAIVALRGDIPVLPVAISGSGWLALPGMFLRLDRREKVTFTVGKTFHLPKAQRLNSEAATEGTRLIMEHIAALLPEEARGYYEYIGNQGEAQPVP